MSQQSVESPNVAIVVPHTGDVSMRWAVRLATLEIPPSHIVTNSAPALDLAREQTVEDALSRAVEWVLFLDADVIPPVDVFEGLARHELPVVSGLYYTGGDPIHPAAWKLNDDNSPATLGIDEEGRLVADDDGEPVPLEADENGLVTVDAVGLGCLLVHASVFEDIKEPWFRWTEGYEDHPWDLRTSNGRRGVSEDFFFCHRLAEAGYDIHLDTGVHCGHEKGCLLTNDGVFLESQLGGE